MQPGLYCGNELIFDEKSLIELISNQKFEESIKDKKFDDNLMLVASSLRPVNDTVLTAPDLNIEKVIINIEIPYQLYPTKTYPNVKVVEFAGDFNKQSYNLSARNIFTSIRVFGDLTYVVPFEAKSLKISDRGVKIINSIAYETKNGELDALIALPRNLEGSFKIPENVKFTYSNALFGNNLREISFPNSFVLDIAQCSSSAKLEKVVLPKDCKEIPDGAFFDCTKLKNINLENIETVEAKAFAHCKNLKEVYMPNCSAVGKEAFYKSGLETVTLKPIQFNTGVDCFADCKNLKTVNIIPDDKAEGKIPYSCFRQCTALEEIKLDSISHIEDFAFCDTGLREVIISESVKSIGEYAFAACKNLESVYIKGGRNLEISSNVFGDEIMSPLSNVKEIIVDTDDLSFLNEEFVKRYKNIIKPVTLDWLLEHDYSITEANATLSNLKDFNIER